MVRGGVVVFGGRQPACILRLASFLPLLKCVDYMKQHNLPLE